MKDRLATEKNRAGSGDIYTVLRISLSEHRECMRAVLDHCGECLSTPKGTPPEYAVSPALVPRAFFSLRRNLFSTLFLSTYQLMGIPAERRMLYGKLNHLFRIWVTSADNLLDDENKVVLPLRMPGKSHVMSQVISIMAADRALSRILDQATERQMISTSQARKLGEQTLRRLLPSAAQEATEESGVVQRPGPEYVLEKIHRYKTGLLFHIPFLGPDIIENDLDPSLKRDLRDALFNFGLGCQLLDDVRDMGRDLIEARHNYVLSMIAQRSPTALEQLRKHAVTVEARLYKHAVSDCAHTVTLGLNMMSSSLSLLGHRGLGIRPEAAENMSKSMLKVLDLGDLMYV